MTTRLMKGMVRASRRVSNCYCNSYTDTYSNHNTQLYKIIKFDTSGPTSIKPSHEDLYHVIRQPKT